MKSRKILLTNLLILFVIASICLTGCSSQTVLSLNLKEGSKYETTITINQTMVQDMEGEKMTSTMDYVMGCSIESKGKDDEGNQKIDLGYTSLAMTIGMPELGLQMKFDTADESTSNEVTEMLRKFIDKKFTVTVSPEGNIVKIEGLDNLLKELLDETMTGDEESGEEVVDLNEMFSEDYIKQTFENSSWVSSPEDKELKVGTTWTGKVSSTLQDFPMEIEVKYTVKDIKGKKVTVSVEAAINITEGSVVEDEEGLSMKYNLEGSQSGELVVDIDTGLVMNGELTTEVTGNMSMDMEIMTLDIPIDMKQVIKIETVKK